MSYEDFWVLFWKLAAGVLAISIVTMGGCSAYTTKVNTEAIQQMTDKGADPVKAACAVYNHTDATVCVAAVSKNNAH